MMDFNPNSPTNVASAAAAQIIGDAKAQSAADTLLIAPPEGFPGLTSIKEATVLGYCAILGTIREVFDADGNLKVPGDDQFYNYQAVRLGWEKSHACCNAVAGWESRERAGTKLYASIKGNPIMLEDQARSLGYSRALATAPNWLFLAEI